MAVKRARQVTVLPRYERNEESKVQGDAEEWEATIARLSKSIGDKGLLEKITLSEDGKTILDGWHRYNALLLIHPKGIPTSLKSRYFKEYDPEDNSGMTEAEFSYHKNANRRQQTLLQRIEAAAHHLGIDPRARGAQVKLAEEIGVSQAAISKALNPPEEKKATPKVQSIAKRKKRKPTDPLEALEFKLEELEEKAGRLEVQLEAVEEQIEEVEKQIAELKGDYDG